MIPRFGGSPWKRNSNRDQGLLGAIKSVRRLELLESWSDSVILHGDCVLDGDGLNQVADAIFWRYGAAVFPENGVGHDVAKTALRGNMSSVKLPSFTAGKGSQNRRIVSVRQGPGAI